MARSRLNTARPCLTERLLMGRKESNQTNKQGQDVNIFGSPAKHGRHIGIVSPSVSVAPVSHFWFPITFEGIHQFHSKFKAE